MADLHVIDPFADTIISLRNPSTEFAVSQDEEMQSNTYESSTTDSESDSKDPVHELAECMAAANLDEESPVIQYHVSSSHLIFASKVFFVKASPRWDHGKLADGKYHHSAEGWDPEAFLLLMNIFHLRHSQLPEKVSLEMMAKLAVLVDFYDCEEAVERPVQRWIEILKEEIKFPRPFEYGRDLVLWICIARVFLLPEVFSWSTRKAMYTARGPIQSLGLPIEDTVEAMNGKRKAALDTLMTEIATHIENYRRPDYRCPHSDGQSSSLCGSYLLAAFNNVWEHMTDGIPALRSIATVEDFWKHGTTSTYPGTSFKMFRQCLDDRMQLDDSTFQHPNAEPSHDSSNELCNFKQTLLDIYMLALEQMYPLHLEHKHSRITYGRRQPPWGLPFDLPILYAIRIDTTTSTALVRRAENLTEEEYHQWPSERIPRWASKDRPMLQVKIHFEASSRHLALASEPFRNELARPKATARGGTFPRSYLELGLHDEKLLCTFLNVLHVHNSKVPKCLPIEKLETIGEWATKYQCAEAFSEWARVWMTGLPKVDPKTPFSTLLKRAHIAWTFGLQDEFGKETLEAIKRSEGVEKMSSSTVGPLEAEIERARQGAFYRIVTGIVNLPSARNMKRKGCTYPGGWASPIQCALTSLCLQMGQPACPARNGWSLEHLYLLVVHSPRFPYRDVKGAVDNYHCCYKQLKGVKEVVERVWEELEGLDLKDVKSKMSG